MTAGSRIDPRVAFDINNTQDTNRESALSTSFGATQPSPAASGVITQEMLGAFQELNEVLRERDSFRRRIMDMLDAGVPIEPGPLTASIWEREQAQFSFRRLADLLGEKKAESLRRRIEPTLTRTLKIERRTVHRDAVPHLPTTPGNLNRPPRRNMADHMTES